MRLPDFIIIGAAKAGTTSLYASLSGHPDIFMSTPKEPEFFARDDRHSAGIAHYAQLFAGAGPGQVCGEASTLYSLASLFPETPARIRAAVPGVKLIYVLREPVARAYSYYVQLVKNRQNAAEEASVARSFEECLFPEDHPGRAPRDAFFAGFDAHLPDRPELFLDGSDYARQIRAYLAHFDRSDLHLVSFEAFMANPDAALADVCTFLGVDPTRLPAGGLARANISEDHFGRVGRAVQLDRLRARLGPLSAPLRLLPRGLRRTARGLLPAPSPDAGPKAHVPPPMQPATEAFLRDHFRPLRADLEQLSGLDLSAWDRGPRRP